MPASSTSATGWPWSSRWRATTTRATSSPIRARRPASAASCAMCSPWARGRSPASMRLSFGAPSHPKTRHLVSGVVAGIGGYGNSFGVPTVGGQCASTPAMTATSSSTRWRSASRATTRFSMRRLPASACRSSISAPRPAATAFTAPRWRRPNSTTIPRRSARPCRSAIRSRKSCCSRPVSRSCRRAA